MASRYRALPSLIGKSDPVRRTLVTSRKLPVNQFHQMIGDQSAQVCSSTTTTKPSTRTIPRTDTASEAVAMGIFGSVLLGGSCYYFANRSISATIPSSHHDDKQQESLQKCKERLKLTMIAANATMKFMLVCDAQVNIFAPDDHFDLSRPIHDPLFAQAFSRLTEKDFSPVEFLAFLYWQEFIKYWYRTDDTRFLDQLREISQAELRQLLQQGDVWKVSLLDEVVRVYLRKDALGLGDATSREENSRSYRMTLASQSRDEFVLELKTTALESDKGLTGAAELKIPYKRNKAVRMVILSHGEDEEKAYKAFVEHMNDWFKTIMSYINDNKSDSKMYCKSASKI